MEWKSMSKKDTVTHHRITIILLNTIHVIVVLLVMFAVFRAIFCVDTGLYTGEFWRNLKESLKLAGLTEWFTFIGAIAFILFGINGIYEYCYSNGMEYLIPPFYQKAKDFILLKQAEKMMNLYYDKDIDFIKTYETERTEKILNTLQLTDEQFHHIRYEILKARAGNISGISSLQQRAKDLLLNKEYVVNLNNVDASERVYEDVNYFINLYTALLDDKVFEDAGRLMTNFLSIKTGYDLESIDCIVIPYGSNLLLGLSVAKKLGIRLISVLQEGRMLKEQPWDGEYPKKENGEKIKIAMLHDILVSGKRIYKSLEALPKDSFELVGVFSLIYYKTETDTLSMLKENGIPNDKVHHIIEVSDEEMAAIINE